MQNIIGFLNNNAAVMTVVGVVLGWALNSITGAIRHRRQQKDNEAKERRERFAKRAEFDTTSRPSSNHPVHSIDAVFTSYKVTPSDDGLVDVIYPDGLSNEKLKSEVIYLRNIGSSDINECEIAVSIQKSTALLPLRG